ncbi:DUF2726 domain-containing protein [Halomonas sp. HP20-15]|uniref:DUF2726 domain-containing protein n=1 Tax=Halomonas sp. HP20-15 TaxID=3085901 RepID=UPI002981C749|nr:DUF2726 domain-containing protein [Halomonas sp. HP20-15]MDW5376539.1 DUF2726 domain-containing protein [Halomonas sp. HP20-15]
MDSNPFVAALWQGLEPLLTDWWPILLLVLAMRLAKPWLKKQRRRGRKPQRSKGFFERITPILNDARGARRGGAIAAGDGGPFKAGDVLPEHLAKKPTESDRNYSEKLMDQGGAYVARTHLMSPSERQVYQVLEKAYGDRYRIFCQVRVVDLIQPNMKKHHSWTREYKSLFRQLSQWHFDYVLCEKKDFRIVYAVELDDPSHERPDRRKRDAILDKACGLCGVVLKRVVIDRTNKSVKLKV